MQVQTAIGIYVKSEIALIGNKLNLQGENENESSND